MDTNSKQFQDALQNLTTAFFQFLDVVNPGGADREANIRYIAQSIQALAANMGALPVVSANTHPVDSVSPQIEPTATVQTVKEPVVAQTIVPASSQNVNFPQYPNLGREQPSKIDEGVWGFKRLTEYDETQYFRFYIEGEDGMFDMRDISDPADWTRVYNSRNEIMPSEVVVVEGDFSPSARLETIEKGVVHSEGTRMRQYWHVIKPCRVKVTPV